MKKIFLLFTALFVCCISNSFAQKIITTIHPYYSLVRQIAPKAEVIRLLPVGFSSHSFDPTPSMIINLATADLIILNGIIDEWIYNAVRTTNSKAKVIEIFELVVTKPIRGGDHGNYNSQDFDGHKINNHQNSKEGITDLYSSGNNRINPHIWLDPILMMSAALIIANQLVQIDPANANSYLDNARELNESLLDLDKELEIMLKPVRDLAFVPFHDAWRYFARRYRLSLIVEVQPLQGKPLTISQLTNVLEKIEKSKAKALFSEVQLPRHAAEVILELTSIKKLAFLDSIGGGDETKSYQELLYYNAKIILEALK